MTDAELVVSTNYKIQYCQWRINAARLLFFASLGFLLAVFSQGVAHEFQIAHWVGFGLSVFMLCGNWGLMVEYKNKLLKARTQRDIALGRETERIMKGFSDDH